MTHMFRRSALALAVVAAVAPGGCAGTGASFSLTDLVKTTTNDLQQADADAGRIMPNGQVHDPYAHQCYQAALTYIANHPVPFDLPDQKPIGVISAFQDARDVVKGTLATPTVLIPPELVTGCGPLALDVQNDLGQASGKILNLGLHF